MEDGIVKETGYQDTINDKHDIVSNKHRTHEIIGMTIKEINEPRCHTMSLFINFKKHTITGNKSNLHSREESRKCHRAQNADYQRNIYGFIHHTKT